MAATSTSTSTSLKEYLKKYETGGQEQKNKKKKKKAARPPAGGGGGVLIVDEDPVWGKPVLPEAEEEESAGEETPVVDEDIEVKRLRRLEQLRSRKPYHALSEDGSGWVSISDAPKRSTSAAEAHDLSPPRQRRPRFHTPSPVREEREPSDDLSPPRQRRRRRRRRYDSPSPERESKPSSSGGEGLPGEDISPPRRPIRSSVVSDGLSRPRRSKGLTDDLSPPRRSKKDVSEDLSPPRRGSKGSFEDLSPPRRGRRGLQEDLSPPRKERNSLAEDLSPPRRGYHRLVEPNRLQELAESDLSPPRRSEKDDLAVGSSPPRRGRHSPDTDLSASRESRKKHVSGKEERRAGLFTGLEIKEEIDRKKKEEIARFAALDPALSGKGAEAVYRDKEGKRISKEELLKMQKKEEKPKEKKLEWGKGLAQKREAESRALELELEKDKPFARSRDDPELDKMLRERPRWGDPMAHLIKKKHSEPVLEDFGDDAKMKESGFIIPQTIPSHSWIKRGIDPPPNRFGIQPGRHWDGVDRSNGFEKEMFKRQNEKRATETDAYLWSVSDM